VAYHNSGRKEKATAHIDKAVNLALQDGLYGTLAEYTRHFDGMLEDRIALVSESALERVKELSAVYTKSWSKLSGKVRNKLIAQDLTPREREIAKLAAFGFTNKEIAQLKFISESTVKQAVLRIVQKTGVKDRTEIATIL
jgi:DNA-binding NarL/FixJ family response regulator